MASVDCSKCDGNGYITWEVTVPHNIGRDIGYIDTKNAECTECAGYGWLPSHLIVDIDD
jgi:hypothetical protein